jgi:hypothetical protein
MLRWIAILGGLPIMMGQHARSEAPFLTSWLIDVLGLLQTIDSHFQSISHQILADLLGSVRLP